MPAPKLGVVFASPPDPSVLLPLARRAERKGFGRIWLVEVAAMDAVAMSVAVAGATKKIGVATGVANSNLRQPYALAMGAATASNVSHGRFALGVGAGASPMGYTTKIANNTPVTRLEETLTVVRKLLANERVTFRGRLFDAPGVKLGIESRYPVKVFAAAMGPGMARLAGRCADGVIFMLPTIRYIGTLRKALEEGMKEREERPRSFPIACHFVTAADEDKAAALRTAKLSVARYAGFPAYRNNFVRLGFGREVAAIARASKGRGLEAGAESVPDSMADSVIIHGDGADCARKLKRFVEEGVSEPIVYPASPSPAQFPEALRRTIDLLAGHV